LSIFSACDKTTTNASQKRVEQRLSKYYWELIKVDTNNIALEDRERFDFQDNGSFNALIYYTGGWHNMLSGDWRWEPEYDYVIIEIPIYDDLYVDTLRISVLSTREFWFSSHDEFYKYKAVTK
jgi:hypothetical protein